MYYECICVLKVDVEGNELYEWKVVNHGISLEFSILIMG